MDGSFEEDGGAFNGYYRLLWLLSMDEILQTSMATFNG
jgi:hypothetical protein